MIFSSTHPLVSGFFHSSLENQRGFCHNKEVASAKERTIPMRIRKDQDDMQDAEITLIATVSDAHPHVSLYHASKPRDGDRLQQRPC